MRKYEKQENGAFAQRALYCALAAEQLLRTQKPCSLSFFSTPVRERAFPFSLHFVDIEEYCRTVGIEKRNFAANGKLPEGITLRYANGNLILYREDGHCGPSRLNFTLAHEIGHIVLSHDEQTASEESEADAFAAAYLMPEPVMRHLMTQYCRVFGKEPPPSVMRAYFPVSAAAMNRRMAQLRCEPYQMAQERDVLLQTLTHLTSDASVDAENDAYFEKAETV